MSIDINDVTLEEMVDLIYEGKVDIESIDKFYNKDIHPRIKVAIVKTLNFDKCLTPIETKIVEKLFKVLSEDEEDSIRCSVAASKNTPSYILAILAKDKSNFVRRWIAENPKTPADILVELAKDSDYSVVYNVAKNPNTPIKTLEYLSKNECFKEHIVRNLYYDKCKTTEDKDILDNLFAEFMKDKDMLTVLGFHDGTPLELLKVLAKDKNPWVKLNVFLNPSIPLEIAITILKELLKVKDEKLKINLVYRLNYDRFKTDADKMVVDDAFELLSKDKSVEIRKAVAGSKHTPIKILEILGEDEEEVVKMWLVGNPNTPIEIIKKIALSKCSSNLRKCILDRNSDTKEILEILIDELSGTNFEYATCLSIDLLKTHAAKYYSLKKIIQGLDECQERNIKIQSL